MATPRKIRIDSLLSGIKKGEYDDRLSEIQGAIDARNEERQAHILKLVKEVYGEEFVVTSPTTNPQAPPRNPFIDKEREREAEAAASEPAPSPPAEPPANASGPTPPDPLPPEFLAEQEIGDVNQVSDKEREMEVEIERRGPSIGGLPGGPALGPGEALQ